MATFFVKQHDNTRPLDFRLALNGVPVDLTGASILFKMRNVAGGSPLEKAATITGAPTDGAVRVMLTTVETANPGSYNIENQITFGSGAVLTLPADTYDLLTVVPILG